MTRAALNINVVVVATTCATCGVAFGLPEYLEVKKREDGSELYCPNGHALIYGDSELARVKKELERERLRRHLAEQTAVAEAKRAAAAEKSHAREKKRVENGVCPCCNRTFQNLMRHMATKHPKHNEG